MLRSLSPHQTLAAAVSMPAVGYVADNMHGYRSGHKDAHPANAAALGQAIWQFTGRWGVPIASFASFAPFFRPIRMHSRNAAMPNIPIIAITGLLFHFPIMCTRNAGIPHMPFIFNFARRPP
jgi:hypothetical protein